MNFAKNRTEVLKSSLVRTCQFRGRSLRKQPGCRWNFRYRYRCTYCNHRRNFYPVCTSVSGSLGSKLYKLYITRGQKEKCVLNISRETYQDRSQWHTETRTIWRTSLFNSPPFFTVSSTDPRPLCTLVSSTLPHRPFPTFIKLVYRSFTIYIEFPSNPFCCNAFLHTFYKSINNVYK